MLQALRQEFHLGEERAFVSASIGLARYPQDAQSMEALLRHADQALYAAKDAGRNGLRWFTPALQQAAELRVRLANDLRMAVSEHQFEAVYQPIVRLRDGAVCKAEALLRWHHPKRGTVPPSLFIPIAESSGLIHELGDWMLDQACGQVALWRQTHRPDFQISVNRSPMEFRGDPEGQAGWLERLNASGLPGSAVVVEITEGLLLDADSGAAERLAALREAGLSLALDDFGTGYSSLSYLKRYRIDYLKIDQVFVRGLSATSPDLALCRAIIDMAHALGMEVIAEGVETENQCDLLTAAGCDHGQGHWFSRPLSAAAMASWLAERRSETTSG
jgi:EAL domain-containing protein (putative c-di-GMP-specific phosphodiesterase class I)